MKTQEEVFNEMSRNFCAGILMGITIKNNNATYIQKQAIQQGINILIGD